MELNHDFKAEIRVDGVPRELSRIWEHSRDDPYAGGHLSELIFDGKAAQDHLGQQFNLPLEARSRLDKSMANLFFNIIHFATAKGSDSTPTFEFVFNTIDRTESSEGLLSIAGECSPFVR